LMVGDLKPQLSNYNRAFGESIAWSPSPNIVTYKFGVLIVTGVSPPQLIVYCSNQLDLLQYI